MRACSACTHVHQDRYLVCEKMKKQDKGIDDFLERGPALTRKEAPFVKPRFDGWIELFMLRLAQEQGQLHRVKDVVVLVHGTFAASEWKSEDENLALQGIPKQWLEFLAIDTESVSNGQDTKAKDDGWWQMRHDFHVAISRKGRVVLHFHWSGSNTEFARRQAGVRLWLLLTQLEDMGLKYSIVAHSHGGMVVRHALIQDVLWHEREAKKGVVPGFSGEFRGYAEAASQLPTPKEAPMRIPIQGEEHNGLPMLQKCVTLGTPFLNLSISRVWQVVETIVDLVLITVMFLVLPVLVSNGTLHWSIAAVPMAVIMMWIFPSIRRINQDRRVALLPKSIVKVAIR